MLQQTQALRVVEPWTKFLARFPDARSCADATLADVLVAWRGLGYHRRARSLHAAARVIRDQFDGAVPRDVADLLTLPGVGRYTAGAVASFAFARRAPLVDTNVGRVFARALANRALRVGEAYELAEGLLPARSSARFNQALIDLGAQYCRATPRCERCPLRRSCRWRGEGGDDPAPSSAGVSKAQAPFAGSTRQVRGRLVEALREGERDRADLALSARDVAVLEDLLRDGLVRRTESGYALAVG